MINGLGMKKLRITITMEEECPEGTALMFALAEVLKDIPAIAMSSGTEKVIRAMTYVEPDVDQVMAVRVASAWARK